MYKRWEFRKNSANESPLRGKLMAKIRNFHSFGGCIPTFLPRTTWNLARKHVYRGNMSPLRGEKPIFGPLSKNNTGMAALRTGLPLIMLNLITYIMLCLSKHCSTWTEYVRQTVTVSFLSRVSILTRDIDIANLSVRPSVRYVPVSDENGLTYRRNFSTVR